MKAEAIGDAIYGMKSTNKNHLVARSNKKRRCVICKKLLSVYTIGIYCHAHMSAGQAREDALVSDKIENERKAHNKKMRIKAENKRKEKHGLQSSK